MTTFESLDNAIARWRDGLPTGLDLAAAETRLRAEAAALAGAGLSAEETVLVAAHRAGAAFDRAPAADRWTWHGPAWREAAVAFALAVIAALAIKLPALWGVAIGEVFYARNLALFALPPLVAYLAWKRGGTRRARVGWVVAFVAAAVVANLPRFVPNTTFELLLVLHLPIALWLAVAVAHAGGRWREVGARMDFVRFSGEWFVHYVLIALGGAVLMGFTFALFESLGLDAEPFFERWMLPCGAMGAVVVAAWLVETRQGAIESLASMLTRLFTPLFTVLLLAVLATMAWTGRGPGFHREMLIAYDLLLALVVGLLLFALAGRRRGEAPGWFDRLQWVLVLVALLVDAAALWSIARRIAEFGFTPNRVAALGENLILLVNLLGSAVLHAGFLRGRAPLARLEQWQVRFLPVYAGWAAIVVMVFPLVFAR